VPGSPDGPPASRSAADAVSALVNLGYPQVQASAAIASALKAAGETASAEDLIRRGLRELAR
jgi:Holliday junction DNA helicase RuvA